MYLLDTDICVDYLRDRLPVADRVQVQADLSGAAMVTAAELLHGAALSRDPVHNRAGVMDLLGLLTLLDFDWDCALTFGQLKADLQERGQLIPDFDLVVAATALTHSLTLVTANMAHFARIPKLHTENWREVPEL